MTEVIAVANEKGGAGKSTMVANLAAAWGRGGRRVLAIDLDPQFNLTEMFGHHPFELDATLVEVLAEDKPLAEVVIGEVCPGVDLAPASKQLADVEHTLVTMRSREHYLRRQLFDSGQIDASGYDICLIDCPPQLGELTVNALYVNPTVICPVDMTDRNAWKGAASLLETIGELAVDLPELTIDLVVPNAVSGHRRLYKGLIGQLRGLGPPIAKTEIPLRAEFQNSGASGVPLVTAQPAHPGAAAYIALAREINRRAGRSSLRKAA